MGHNGCDGSQASGPWAIGSGYRFSRAEPWIAYTRVIPRAQRLAYSPLMHHVYAGKGDK